MREEIENAPEAELLLFFLLSSPIKHNFLPLGLLLSSAALLSVLFIELLSRLNPPPAHIPSLSLSLPLSSFCFAFSSLLSFILFLYSLFFSQPPSLTSLSTSYLCLLSYLPPFPPSLFTLTLFLPSLTHFSYHPASFSPVLPLCLLIALLSPFLIFSLPNSYHSDLHPSPLCLLLLFFLPSCFFSYTSFFLPSLLPTFLFLLPTYLLPSYCSLLYLLLPFRLSFSASQIFSLPTTFSPI